MRLRKIEFIVIALTFAFVCFIGGYFAGSKGSVNISAMVETQNDGPVQPRAKETLDTGSRTALPDNAAESADMLIVENSPTASVQTTDKEPEIILSRSDGKININAASHSELMDLPGIGTVLASRIIDYRNQNGAFSNIEEIMKVSGIGAKKFEAIKDNIKI